VVGEPDQWSWDGVNQPRSTPAPGPNPPAGWGQPPQDPAQPPQGQYRPDQYPPDQYPPDQNPPDQNPPDQYPPDQSYAAQQRALTGGQGPFHYGTVSYRPGVIPLRPLGFGEFFDGSFRSIQHNPQVMFGLSLLVALSLGLLEAILFGSALGDLMALDPDTTAIPAGPLGAIMGGSVVAGLVSLLATIVLNGLLVTSVSQSVLGRRVSIGAVWQQAKGLLWRLVGLSLLIGAIQSGVIVGAVVLVVAMVAGLAAVGSDALWAVLLLGFVTVIGAGVLAAFFYVKLAIASPVLMMERTGVFAALGRSWNLTTGFFWRNLGVIVVATIVTGAISGVASLPISIITSGLLSLGTEFLWIAGAASVLLAALLSALVTPFLAAITALLYVDIRMRKEGLDVELIRAVGDSL
jgi:hypothetical protein